MEAGQEPLKRWLDDGVMRLRLNRPEKANSLDAQLLQELDDALAQVAQDDEVRVILIDAAGAGFSGGYAISPSPKPGAPAREMPDDWLDLRAKARRWLDLQRHPKPTIAKVHGYCLAGGLELAMACDLVVAARDASFGFPAVRAMGVPPFMIYPLLAPMRHVKRWLLTGDTIDGDRAFEWGIANESVAPEELEESALRLARRVALMPLDQLVMLKGSLVRAYEQMGLESVALTGVEFNAMAHRNPSVAAFRSLVQSEGFSAAVRHRDGPFEEAEDRPST
jgi:enoyl-CoA hydratase